MKWMLDFPPFSIPQLQMGDGVFGLGSCFGETIVGRLLKAPVAGLVNPFGTVYHPIPMMNIINRLVEGRPFVEADVEEAQGRFFSYHSHTLLSGDTPESTLTLLNEALEEGRMALKQARFVVLTWGTNWGYVERQQEFWVANCQKQPASYFKRSFPSLAQLETEFQAMLQGLKEFNPHVQIVQTVSPVRHLKDGLVENAKSKARLLEFAHAMVEAFPKVVFYLPTFELVIDALRDYRFFGPDLVHLNSMGEDAVWEWLGAGWFSSEFATFYNQWLQLYQQSQHRPLLPNSEQHRVFQVKLQAKISDFEKQYKVPFQNPRISR